MIDSVLRAQSPDFPEKENDHERIAPHVLLRAAHGIATVAGAGSGRRRFCGGQSQPAGSAA
ncbi:hypothetical protein KOSB73_260505 [Klebsiella grimontii]|uniref:Uncharacterized protein n=1 Tax=Klebsiella grimontii TaxID=2058152 RepID=A0A285B478_9ENTR|nr:hypothetical protein KOSB73_260505 [Klebsiella grimontii]